MVRTQALSSSGWFGFHEDITSQQNPPNATMHDTCSRKISIIHQTPINPDSDLFQGHINRNVEMYHMIFDYGAPCETSLTRIKTSPIVTEYKAYNTTFRKPTALKTFPCYAL